MPSLASGLLRGLTAYQQGKTEGEDRRLEIERQRRQEERQQQQMAMQAEMQRASLEAMRQTAERQKVLDRIADENRQREDSEGGYRSQAQTGQLGASLSPAQGQMMGGGPLTAALPSIARLSGDLMAASSGPAAFTRNGVGMVKGAESMQERDQRLQAQQRQGERMQSNEDALKRDQQNAQQRAAEIAAQQRFTASENAKSRAATRENSQMRSTTPKLTDGQRRAGGLVDIATAEAAKMDSLGVPGLRDRLLAQVPFGLGDALMTDKGQQYVAAAEAFTRPYLYTMSGASAPEGEVRGNARTVIPGPFTKEGAASAMSGRRGRMLEGMKTIAGQPGDAPPDEKAPGTDELRTQAVDAIRRGADPAKVKARFEQATGQRWD